MKCDYPKEVAKFQKSMDIRINVGSGNGSNLRKDTRVNIDSKIEFESQSCGLGSHSFSSSISSK